MNATLNTFPPLQSMNSPRGLILGAIVLLHLGFLLLLSSGMGDRIREVLRPPAVMVVPPTQRELERLEPKPVTRVDIEHPLPWVPTPDEIPVIAEEPPQTAPRELASGEPPAVVSGVHGGSTVAPVISTPDIDPRIGLSEPLYPASEIRAEHTGTVVLSIYVLANGRVGDVRLDQSSGYPKLDESALREARKWRLKPGMRDGVPIPMWKQIPVTFQLQGAGSRRF